MKTLKTLICALALTGASLAFCATSAKATPYIGTVSNCSTLTITLIIKSTTTEVSSNRTMSKDVITTQHLANKDLLDLFTNADFAGTNFPAGARLVMGWDQAWSDHVLVVDKTGTNVIYDASGSTNPFSINFHEVFGADSASRNNNNPGGYNETSYNIASVTLVDTGVMTFNLLGTGPCTETTALSRNSSGEVTSWTDSEDFNFAGADQTIPSTGTPFAGYTTISGTIRASGHAKDRPYYFTPQP